MEKRNNGKFMKGHKEQTGEHHSNWRGGITGNYKLQHQLYKLRHPEKNKAQKLLSNAVYNKKIIKPTCCSKCNKNIEKRLLHGHHNDYSKPLDVIWLCKKCHEYIHRGYKRL